LSIATRTSSPCSPLPSNTSCATATFDTAAAGASDSALGLDCTLAVDSSVGCSGVAGGGAGAIGAGGSGGDGSTSGGSAVGAGRSDAGSGGETSIAGIGLDTSFRAATIAGKTFPFYLLLVRPSFGKG
jgi:hypothetical protein